MFELPDKDQRVIDLLRDGRVHAAEQIAATLDIAPFELRAILRELERRQLLRPYVGGSVSGWILTHRGFAAAHHLEVL